MTLMALPIGTRLGPYEITAPLGAGGMGEVYKARDTRLNRIVAIKVSREQFSERFEREAHAVAALNHSNICTLHDVGPNYLVMEYIEGTPLRGPLPVHQALKYAAQICDALDAAHRKGITHRDLKPGNILVTKTRNQAAGLWSGQDRTRLQSPSDATLSHGAHRQERDRGYALLHVARAIAVASDRPGDRCAQRHFLVRLGAV